MLFTSVPFLFYFLPCVLAAYAAVQGRAGKNAVLLVASLVFYAWGEAFYLLALLGSIAVNHLIGRAIGARDGAARGRALAFGLIANLAFLGAFKYLGFFTAQLAPLGVAHLELHLPLGVSFFTFQAMSYLIDVARGSAPASRSVAKTGLFIALFPQLIAGPIVRFKDIERQLEARRESWLGFAAGAQRFVLGLGQKVLIADTLARPADAAFGAPAGGLTPDLAWLGALAYALQIYFDFAGYSNMAIGLGRMFGLKLPANFEHPYWSSSFQAFWRRWHMTLSAWFRDYLYIPLGGNRAGRWRTIANLALVFVICGLWHGAAWTFVLWGVWHGAFLGLERAGLSAWLARAPGLVGGVYTALFVTLGWVLFRAESLEHAGRYWAAMAGLAPVDAAASRAAFFLSNDVVLALLAGLVLATPYPARWARAHLARRTDLAGAGSLTAWGGVGLCLVLSVLVSVGRDYAPFIYFRF